MENRDYLNLIEKRLANPGFAKLVGEAMEAYDIKYSNEDRSTEGRSKVEQEQRVRGLTAHYGYRLMHRRGEQYWLMFANPMTLSEIERCIDYYHQADV
jgi:hypothetical protein